jgi:hypothetical protein
MKQSPKKQEMMKVTPSSKRIARTTMAHRNLCHICYYIFLITSALLGIVVPFTRANTIPRSTSARSIDPNKPRNLLPWNSSPKIDPDGFLSSLYHRIHGEWEIDANVGGKWFGLQDPVYIRQVPGDGACLFHSCTVALALVANNTHIDMRSIRKIDETKEGGQEEMYDLTHLYHHSRYLRHMAVDVLSRNPRRLLFLQGNEYLRARDLVSAAASQYDLTPEEYCEQMRHDSYWGGGPEIVALCNFLKRPIHVYELHSSFQEEKKEHEREGDVIPNGGGGSSSFRGRKIISPKYNKENGESHQFQLRRMACFGSPKFDRREPLNILSADCRFPDIDPGQQIPSGNHFLAIFPESLIRKVDELDRHRNNHAFQKKRNKRAGIRGGSSSSTESNMNDVYTTSKSKSRRNERRNISDTLEVPLSLKDRVKQYFHLFIPFGMVEYNDDQEGQRGDRRWYEQVLDRLKLAFW